MSNKILVVSGASGGHIFPALSFLETLREEETQKEVLLVLPKRGLGNKIALSNFAVKYISISPIAFNLGGIINLFNFLKGILESLFILLEFQPGILVAFGSLACVPMVILAWGMRIKILIHEQNVIPGRANRLLATFADRVAISFSETSNYFKGSSKVILTGNPLRKELKICDKKKGLDFFGLSDNKFTILVMGGSQGSHKINLEFQGAIAKIQDRDKLQVIHLAGDKDYGLLKDAYKGLGIEVRLFDFLKDMQYAYSACDLVLARAGAMTISELILFRLPAIIIPYPFAYKHQLANAKVLEEAGAALIIDNEKLDSDTLAKAIIDFMDSPFKIKERKFCYDNIPNMNTDELLLQGALSLN